MEVSIIGRVEVCRRKTSFFNRYGKHVGQVVWLMDFIVKRVLPKLRPFNKIYRFFSSDWEHPRSKAEILGRLYTTDLK
jgi:hypothetical protein